MPASRTVVRRAADPAAARPAPAGPRRAVGRQPAPPILVRQVRGAVVESVHRGCVVEARADGTMLRSIGDVDRPVNLRSCVKPFSLVALVEAGGVEAFELSSAELAVMASSHSGEDLHVRTIQGVFRRANLSQQLLACGSDGAPLDALTAARLARDGEKPGPIRHMCSGQHASLLLLSRLADWPLEEYWRDDHPAQAAVRSAVARAFGTTPERLVLSIDGCGIPTYAFPLREVARAFAMLADPAALPMTDPRRSLAQPLIRVRDAMLANPELVAGTRDRLDTSLMKALPGRIVSKGGMEGLRGVSILAGPRAIGSYGGPSGLALKIEDGGGYDRAPWATTVEALRQAGVLDGLPLRSLARYHRPRALDPHGRLAGESVADFELAPVGELIG
ncbi:MAG TPA: asparaginase [Candidatus Limnocylindrales bacterium]